MKICILDTETTGLNPHAGDKIIEFACILANFENNKFEIEKEIDFIIDPKKTIDKKIEILTSITNEDLKGKSVFEDVKEQIQNSIQNRLIIGHNVKFDINFLKHEGVIIDEAYYLDTYDLAQMFILKNTSLSLENLAKSFDIEHQKHRAIGDVKATIQLLSKMLDIYHLFDDEMQNGISDILSKTINFNAKLIFIPQKKIYHQFDIKKYIKIDEIISNHVKKLDYVLDLNKYDKAKQKIIKLDNLLLNKAQIVIDSIYENKKEGLIIVNRSNKDQENYINESLHIHKLISANRILSIEKTNNFILKNEFMKDEALCICKILYYLYKNKYVCDIFDLNLSGKLQKYAYQVTFKNFHNICNDEIIMLDYMQKIKNNKLFYTDSFSFFKMILQNDFPANINNLYFLSGESLEKDLDYANKITINSDRIYNFIEEHNLDFLIKDFDSFFIMLKVIIKDITKLEEINNREIKISNNFYTSSYFWKLKTVIENLISKLHTLDKEDVNTKYFVDNVIYILEKLLKYHWDHLLIFYVDIQDNIYIQDMNKDINSFFFDNIISKYEHITIFTNKTFDFNNMFDLNLKEIDIEITDSSALNNVYFIDKSNISFNQILIDAFIKSESKNMFIINNKKKSEEIYLDLYDYLEDKNLSLLSYGYMGSTNKFLSYMKKGVNNVILTSHIIKNYDLYDLDFENFYILKLPFLYTSDEISEYRKKKYKDAFNEYVIPKTVNEFTDIILNINKIHNKPKKIYIFIDNVNYIDNFMKIFKKYDIISYVKFKTI